MSWSSAWAALIWRLHSTVIKPAQYMFYLYLWYKSLLEITKIKAVQYLFFLYLWSIWIERLLQEMKDLRSQNWDLEYIEQHFLAKVAKKSTNQLISIKAVIANHYHLKEIANYLKDFEREKEAMRKEAIMEMTSKV